MENIALRQGIDNVTTLGHGITRLAADLHRTAGSHPPGYWECVDRMRNDPNPRRKKGRRALRPKMDGGSMR